MLFTLIEDDAFGRPADPLPVIERAQVIDLIAGLPRFIPIYGLVR